MIEGGVQLRSTLIASQEPVHAWHAAMADPTLAEAILDRVVHHAHRIALTSPHLTGGSLNHRDSEEVAATPKPRRRPG